MTGKHRKLLQLLPSDGSTVTGGDLAAQLGISVRTVKNYVSELVAEQPGLISSSARGYQADRELLSQVLGKTGQPLPETPAQRVLYMIRRILENEGDVFTLGDFEEELFIGEDTLRKELTLMRRKLKEFDLFIEARGGNLRISGDEANKRRMLSEIIYLEFNENILSPVAIGRAFPSYDVPALKSMLLEVCNEYHYFINEYALMNLVLDLLISIDRIKNNFLSHSSQRQYQFGEREQTLARTIVERIEALYDVEFNHFELDELTILLFGHLTKLDYKSLTVENISDSVGPESLRLIELIRQELDEFELLDFANPDFFLRFTMHIHNLLNRLEHNYVTKNPLTEQIKQTCTFIYELAVIIAGIINQETGQYVDQHETAYIALHIGSMLQLQQSLRNKARCLLVYPQYYDYAGKIIEQLTEAFGTSLVFLGVATHSDELTRYGDLDLVLSTINLPPSTEYESVMISPFLIERDRSAIQSVLDLVVKRKKAERVRKSLLAISSPDLFRTGVSFSNEEEAIGMMARELFDQDYAGEEFFHSVLERERSYSTAYGDVAVPHSMQMNGKKTGMYVALADKPVPWGAGRVRIMLLFCVNREDKAIFYEVFENLIVLLLEPANALRVALCRSYEEFIEVILQCL